MFKYIIIVFIGILTSSYFFPFEFTILPGANTKMIMAGVSLLVLGVQIAQKKDAAISKDFFLLSALAGLVSLSGLVAVVYNDTNDYSYVTYIMSMWVWLGGAYLVVNCMRWLHKEVSVKLLVHYLIGVCVAQCLLALLIDMNPSFKYFVNTYVAGLDYVQFDRLNQGGRLYGIGAALDVAGLRFSTVLIMICYFCMKEEGRMDNKKIVLYLTAFCVIAVVGNMISRTTIMGVGLSLGYWIYVGFKGKKCKREWMWIIAIGGGALLISTYLYHANDTFKENIRFAFEGFFSLWEKGEWSVSSNDRLMNMFVFPDSLKTWLIGDGYMLNPYDMNPNYVGPNYHGFYKETDVGYLRFIFYFGMIGLCFFILFFTYATQICIRRFKVHYTLFLLILSVNFIGWVKVSTDIFLVFALFLCISKEEHSTCNKIKC